jgi:hypothetical protein
VADGALAAASTVFVVIGETEFFSAGRLKSARPMQRIPAARSKTMTTGRNHTLPPRGGADCSGRYSGGGGGADRDGAGFFCCACFARLSASLMRLMR